MIKEEAKNRQEEAKSRDRHNASSDEFIALSLLLTVLIYIE